MNNMLGECDYRTPCYWCVKWDKPCDKKQGYSQIGVSYKSVNKKTDKEVESNDSCEK